MRSSYPSLQTLFWCRILSPKYMEKLQHLHGMHDILQESWQRLRAGQDYLREFFSLHGYRMVETPILEPTELFLRKSGGELAARMYTFIDPGGNQVSLRPEYTASIVRRVLEKDTTNRLPIRAQYAGPVFRYEKDSYISRQFTQVGAELLGSYDPRADAEVLSLSCMALSGMGLSGHRLAVGDLGVLHKLLESLGLSERAVIFILSSIGDLKSGQDGIGKVLERAKQVRLLSAGPQQSYLGASIVGMEEDRARELLHGFLQWAEVGSLGQREPSEVVERMLRKFRGGDDLARLQRGLEIAQQLAGLQGDPAFCIKAAGELITSYRLDPGVLNRITEVMELLDTSGIHGTTVVLDFGLARDLAYYNGIIFELSHPSMETTLGGGGRYDGLAKALGSHSNMPALGFAYALEPLLNVLEQSGTSQQRGDNPPDYVLVLSDGTGAYVEACRLAQEIRCKGTPVEVDVCGMSVEQGISYARTKGITKIIAVDSDGTSTTHEV